MQVFETVNRNFRAIFDLMYVPRELRRSGEFVVHFSDTPRTFYRSMKRLIDLWEPRAVILTGDCADDVKIGLRPGLIDLYEQGLRELHGVVRDVKNLYITPGNHDDVELLRRHLDWACIDDHQLVTVDGQNFEACHYASELASPGAIGLFGHDGTAHSTEGHVWYNGQLHINLFDRQGAVYQLSYPRFVEDARQMRRLNYT